MLLILRDATAALRRLARGFPVVAVTGPRQSGKTTLVRATFPGKAYISLEDPDERAFALADPRAFLGRFARGALFESLLVSEWLKHRFNRALPANAFFWRDNVGNEIDLLLDHGRSLQPVEMKSGQTPSGDYFGTLRKWLAWAGPRARRPAVVYGGSRTMQIEGVRLLGWREWPETPAGKSAQTARGLEPLRKAAGRRSERPA